MATAAPSQQPRSALRNGLNLRRKNNVLDDTGSTSASGSGSGPSGTVSEPPPSPHQAYFDKYPKRAERIRERDKDKDKDRERDTQSPKHVTIEFPTIPERKASSSRHGLRDWRVVQAHLEPRVAPRPKRKDKERENKEKIRDPDDMVIVSLAGSSSPASVSPTPSTSPLPSIRSEPHEHSSERTPTYAWPSRDESRRRPAKAPQNSFDRSTSYSRHVPTSPSLASGFRSSLISSAGTFFRSLP